MSQYLFVFVVLLSTHVFAASSDIIGRWRTIDDETQKPKSIVEITKIGDLYEGKVLKLFKAPHEEQNPKCDQCEGELKDKPIIGLRILRELKQRESDWGDGKIIDPNNGKSYDVKMQLIDDGAKLKVRGFIGFALLGRTQVWERVE